ncbi:MAG: agmatine deiminase family protein [Flavobacteriia bacterium]|nr:agmatine deiminase family protein [Flavobacteriia bacterium]OIP46261.1 MAG: agmatine deiminase [Flavobacteriaceae bacterium CG2_30_31_66]PIV95960.1 MAG: agmatine deiminase [Flavobacteriaceae bacterium CG17_big_fil_post_rev_8_21_14_2_50_31_13]PIX13570.1 MAG: agmatine deiminase [Flavobacteriaceae bacterium CG_4_8_14_3_um_filter_31_8]PIY16295.1 MAG: agmatine deiminase [Flavobacteriaceae bacterium CG_4_10_14_3_um_filter_31_253]PIZ11956.1 MAG: agmatine deiminase [Flavobacteriaceae bacterium CG_4
MRRFPAEWENQEGILLCFPHNGNDWPGKYGAIQWAFIEFIKKISEFEKVFLIVADKKLQEKVSEMLMMAHVSMDKISFIIHKTNRSWMRDSGPIIVQNGSKREAINFNFNGWAKYKNYQLDKFVPSKVANHLNIPLTQAKYKGKPVILEGGAIDVNGKGTLLTSEECLLHPTIQIRNPNFTKEDYEAIFKEFLGITNVIWLGDGIIGDDTHGHIDDLCRFVNEKTIITVVETDTKSPNYAALQDNLERLQKAVLEDGKKPTIVTLPMPKKVEFDGLIIPASYANFLIINKIVLVPTFNDANDRNALNIIADCFPDREIIGISAIDLIWGFGTLHCLSQQIPE